MTIDTREAARWRKFKQAAKHIWNPANGSITFYLPRGAGRDDFEAVVDALPDPGPSITKDENVRTLTVVLEPDIDAEHLHMLYSCISVIKGVIAVKSNVAEPGEYVAIERAKAEIRKKLAPLISEDTECSPLFPRR